MIVDDCMVSKDRNDILSCKSISTPLGEMVAGVSSTTLHLLEFADRPERFASILSSPSLTVSETSTPLTDQLQRELDEYFSGKRREFSIPCSIEGTPFQNSVWEALREIPYGETRSYGWLARRLGDPKSVRAVARANGQNGIAILVPCHRVIGGDGSLTGYAGGLDRKKRLLQLEGATSPSPEGQERLF